MTTDPNSDTTPPQAPNLTTTTTPSQITVSTNNSFTNQLYYNTQTNKKNALPTVLLSNIQSFGRSINNDKTTDLETTLNLNSVDIACITETMLTENLINYISFNGYTSFHSVRQDTMRASGGVSIFVKDYLPVKRLNCGAPNIEGLWLSVRPEWLPRKISVLIVACIYYPGSGSDYAPSQEELFLHISGNIHKLSQDYTNPLFIITGDFNNFSVEELCDLCKLNQVVKVPTREDSILDLVLTNINNTFYKPPTLYQLLERVTTIVLFMNP